jgi:HSP20 family protein
MTIRDVVPWKWGGLRRWRSEDEPLTGFRHQMDNLHREMDRLFESITGESFPSLVFPEVFGRELLMPQIDETEDEKAFHVSVELPGMDEKDVDITLSDRRLTIRGEKRQDEKEEGKDYYRQERTYGAFRRTIDLPGEVDESKIEAAFKKGVLKIELPKTKEAQQKVRHIDVKAA